MKCIIILISALLLVFATSNALALRDQSCGQKCNFFYEAEVNECFANNCGDNTQDCRQKCIFATEPVLMDCIVRNCIGEEDAQSASEEAEATMNTQFSISRAVPAGETNAEDSTQTCIKNCYKCYFKDYASALSNQNTLDECLADCNKDKSGLRGTSKEVLLGETTSYK
jgi:hypothetical protein